MKGDDSSNGQSVPLRTILQNFLNLVENYEARRNGGLDSYDSEFQALKQFSECLKSDPEYICKEGERSVNRKKNRYKDILPFDYTRVSLSDYGDVPGSDYINANFIKGASGSSAYIACQGPLPHTVNAFWRMLVECEVQVIVMACNEQESGKHKCENYWVEEDGVEREFGEVTVWLKKCRHVCPDFLIRTMRIRFTNSKGEKEERNVCQFHYSAWPDHGVPTKVRPLLDMVRLIRDCQTSETLPVLVHCSAGCGRTGTICAIDYVWGLLRLGRLSPDFSLFNLVKEMRKQRIAMVQTKDQYIMVHRAVKELFQEQLKLIDSHPYANVDENGLPLEIKRDLEEPTYETLHFTPPSSSCVKDRSPLSVPPPLPPIKSEFTNEIVKADNNNIVVSVSNVNTNGSSKKPLPSLQNMDLTASLVPSTNLTIPIPSRINKSNSTKLEKEIDHPKYESVISKGEGMRTKYMEQFQTTARDEERQEKIHKEKKLSSSSDDTDSINKQGQSSKSSTTSSNPIRSALLRKPSIVKLKSFFEKSNKDDKEKKVPQLSRAKSDVSTRFYSFISSRSSPNKVSATTSTTPSPLAADKNIGNSIPPLVLLNSSKNGEDSKATKPMILAKPTINIKRSKSLKVPIQPDSVKLSAIITNKSSNKRLDKHHTSGSMTSSNPSTSSSGFSNILVDNNPIKVCVKQVEIPKLQAIVSKSVKSEIQKATTTVGATHPHEYDYDISDGSHLRQKNPITSTMLQLEQSKTKGSHQKSASGGGICEDLVNLKFDKSSPSILQPSSSSSYSLGGIRDDGMAKKPTPPSRVHLVKDNHNYVNVAYGNNRSKTGMAKEMEDVRLENYATSGSSMAEKYGKLKKFDTVNSRSFAASLGIANPKHERTSLTRSQSHVWQPTDKQQVHSQTIRIFSDENLHQPTTSSTNNTSFSASKPNYDFTTVSLSRDREPSSPTKTMINSLKNNGNTNGNNNNYSLSTNNNNNNRKSLPSDVGSNFLIQAINADISVQRFDSPSDIIFDDAPLHTVNRNEKVGESTAHASGYHSSSSLTNEKPVVRRRVPKTNPYANYPACVTGNNSKFPFHKIQHTNGPSTMMDESFQMMNDGNLMKDNGNQLPILKPSYPSGSSSQGNSSGSSSNTGTPNSLPSTPTQSVDVLYSQLQHRIGTSSNGGVGNGRNLTTTTTTNGRLNNTNGLKFPSKDLVPGTLSECDDKLDSQKIYSSNTMPLSPSHNNSSSIPKINNQIRIALGSRERRNSFRQAVLASTTANNSTPINNQHYESIDNHPSTSSPPPYSMTPYHKINANDVPPPPRTPKNYEPIWPDTNFTTNNINNNNFRQPLPYTSTASSSLDNRRQPIMSSQSKLGLGFSSSATTPSNHNNNMAEVNHIQGSGWSQSRQNPSKSNSSHHNSTSDLDRRQEQAFQTKVDEIKVMLAELNAPAVVSGNINEMSSSSKDHEDHGFSSSKVPPLKQNRSLRAPSRSQYQQGLSCFTFKKPSSCESIDQLPNNDNDEYEPLVSPLAYGKSDNLTSKLEKDRHRVSNDYVTLQQCRSSGDSSNPSYGQNSRQSSSSPDFSKKHFNSNDGPSSSSLVNASTPIPPPRTKRNLQPQNSSMNRDFTIHNDKHVVNNTTRSSGSSMWPSSTSNPPITPHNGTSDGSSSAYLQPKSTENSSNRAINHNIGTKTNLEHISQHDFNNQHGGEEEEERSTNLHSTSPKAIIRALGLFQAKAANVRSRFANWSEANSAKDRNNASKRGYENGISNNSSDRESSEEPNGRSNNGFRTAPSPGPSVVTPSNGPLTRSKHQYL